MWSVIPVLVPAGTGSAQSAPPAAIQEAVDLLTRPGAGRLWAPEVVRTVYTRRQFEPAWATEDSAGVARAEALVAAISRVDADGLDPQDYHLAALTARPGPPGAQDARGPAIREVLLTDALAGLLMHLARGRVEEGAVPAGWLAQREDPDALQALERAIRTGEIGSTLDAARPASFEYRALVDALADYRGLEAAGGWGTVPAGPTLRLDNRGPRVRALRDRLQRERYLTSSTGALEAADYFDSSVEAAVRAFQSRHGLEVDGLVGTRTLEALNVPASARVRQLAVNLERLRWIPRQVEPVEVRVVVPAFEVELARDGAVERRFRAIVGRVDRRTPLLASAITHIVLSPYWRVPENLARLDKLPAIREDPGYLERVGMDVVERATGRTVAPAGIDWAGISAAEFNARYLLRQRPGPLNALGRVKFDFPNPFAVYLHDTPDRALFDRPRRSFSSGCIRVEGALELAEGLLRERADWPSERLRSVANGGTETRVALDRAVPLRVVYWTAFARAGTGLQFREDLYLQDDLVWSALHARASVSRGGASDRPLDRPTAVRASGFTYDADCAVSG